MPVDVTEPVNLTRSIFICNIFSFLFSASKSCLMPFLTVYLRMLGLTATETGIVIGAKTFSAFIFAPLWSKCATSCRKRKFVLQFALFMMAATYLSLTLIPSVGKSFDACKVRKGVTIPSNLLESHEKNLSTTTAFKLSTSKPATVAPSIVSKNASSAPHVSTSSKESIHSTKLPTTAAPHNDPLLSKVKAIAEKFGLGEDVRNLTADQVRKLVRDNLKYVKDNGLEDLLYKTLSKEELDTLIQFLKIGEEEKVRRKRDLGELIAGFHNKMVEKFNGFKAKILQAKRTTFTIILVVLILGEMLCSPVEKIADDSWFEFLEHIDDMEKYGKHRIWSSVAYILLPIIITLVVDNTDCLFNLAIHPFMLHFYMFGALLGLTFVIGFFYPMPPSDKAQYKSKLTKALSLTCCKLGGLLYVSTLLIMGFIYSSYTNYLFWLIQDLNGTESTMGMCILIATLAELPMLFLGSQLVKKLGNGGVISIALLCLAARTLYYSFLWTPWAVLPAELTHAFTHTAMWFAVLSNRAFQVSPNIDRSIRSVLSSVYFGVGFGIGSILSGVLYDTYGLSILFRACSILSVGWCPIFFLLNRCCHPVPEKDIKYTRLLQADDQSDEEDDDWLEHALKD